jgi:hypothetical protein
VDASAASRDLRLVVAGLGLRQRVAHGPQELLLRIVTVRPAQGRGVDRRLGANQPDGCAATRPRTAAIATGTLLLASCQPQGK